MVIQNLRKIGPGISDLRSDKQTDKQRLNFIYIDYGITIITISVPVVCETNILVFSIIIFNLSMLAGHMLPASNINNLFLGLFHYRLINLSISLSPRPSYLMNVVSCYCS